MSHQKLLWVRNTLKNWGARYGRFAINRNKKLQISYLPDIDALFSINQTLLRLEQRFEPGQTFISVTLSMLHHHNTTPDFHYLFTSFTVGVTTYLAVKFNL